MISLVAVPLRLGGAAPHDSAPRTGQAPRRASGDRLLRLTGSDYGSGMGSRPGLLVAIEGADGAGSTTQARRLADWLRQSGRPVHLTREPSPGPIGRLIRALLAGGDGGSIDPLPGPPLDPAALALLFAADRVDHLRREIEPQRAAGALVVSDRYLMSSLVYQSLAVDHGFVASINRLAPPADLTVLIDVPEEVAAGRRAARGAQPELFETEALQRRVIEGYRRQAERLRAGGERIAIVDGTPEAEVVFERVRAAVQQGLVALEAG